MSDLFGNPVAVEPLPDATIRLTPALRRVLERAIELGALRRAGAYSEGATFGTMEVAEEAAGFEYPATVDRCVAAGWLAPGAAFNTYVPTAAAGEAIAADDRRVADEIKGRMAARAARKAERTAQKEPARAAA